MQKQFYFSILILFGLALLSGCSSMSETSEVPQAQQVASEPAMASEPFQSEPQPEVVPATTFYFDFDDATLRPDVREALEEHAELLKNNAQAVRIEGYADERGTETYNKELGQRRADAVRDLLISKGVDSSQIQTVSFGEQSPQATGSGEIIWQQNRRVVLK